MNFRDFLNQLSADEVETYAAKVGTTSGYLMTHLLYGYKEPRKKLRQALSNESGGKVSELEILEHFGFANQPINKEKTKQATA